jgi:alkyl sulfatase BDS1-like metallo-beta-lactamase superfamily hydrolase
MGKSKMHKDRMATLQQELINDIKTELIKAGATEIALRRNLVVEELDDQFSVVVENVNMNGITLSNPYAEEEEVTFEETDTILLMSILEEIENDRFEIIEELSTE